MPPTSPQLYHITHLRNLSTIIRDSYLWSDAETLRLGVGVSNVGMSRLKTRRLKEIEVSTQPGTFVGEYVPFYFCPRSVMLYLLHKGNSSDLEYKGGQEPIVHLQFDLQSVVNWADSQGCSWTFTDRGAAIRIVDFFSDLDDLDKVNWNAVNARYWQDRTIREHKQAEFLVYRQIPFSLTRRIGVFSDTFKTEVQNYLLWSEHRPIIEIERGWYY